MKKKTLAILFVALILALAGCTPNTDNIPVASGVQDVQGQPVLPTDPPADAEEDMGQAAMNEEGVTIPEDEEGDEPFFGGQDMAGNDPVLESTPYPFTGATPIVLDPIDMPTPTAAPEISFSYTDYNASKLGLTFRGPEGWNINDEAGNTYTLTEPFERDGVTATITIVRDNITDKPSMTELKKLVDLEIDQMSMAEFQSFQKNSVAERTLLGEDGAYTNYRGVLPGGAVVRGRYHVVAVNNVRYTIHLRHAANFNEDYLKNYNEIRRTISASP